MSLTAPLSSGLGYKALVSIGVTLGPRFESARG